MRCGDNSGTAGLTEGSLGLGKSFDRSIMGGRCLGFDDDEDDDDDLFLLFCFWSCRYGCKGSKSSFVKLDSVDELGE